MFSILISVALVLLIYLSFVKPFDYWEKKGVPQYKFWNVWLDFVLGVIQYRNIAERIQKVYNDFPGTRYYGIYQHFGPTLAIKDPALIKQIGVKDFDYFVDHSNFIPDEGDPLWVNNLFFLKGDEWRDMRATLSPSFTTSKMKIMFTLISHCAKNFVQYFQEQSPNTIIVEARDIFTRFANDAIVLAAFGVTCDSMRHKDNELYLVGHKATEFGGGFLDSLKVLFGLMCPRLAKILGIKLIKEDVSNFFKNVIKSNIHSREEEGVFRPDMINLLLEAKKGLQTINPDLKGVQKKQLNDEDITAQALLYYLAGFDSVATLLDFMAYELALNPDVQQKLQKEIDDICCSNDGELSYEDLSKTKYMNMVMSETLRKWPGPIVLHRICAKPYIIQPVRDGEKPIHLKEGDVVWFPIFGIHRDPEFYPEPDRFYPERFSENSTCSVNPYTYLPFGVGPRVCIGTRFTLMETKILFFYLLSKFDIVVVEKTPIPLKLERSLFQLEAEGGIWLGLQPRKNKR